MGEVLYRLTMLIDTLIGIIVGQDFIKLPERTMLKTRLYEFRKAVRDYKEGDGKKDGE